MGSILGKQKEDTERELDYSSIQRSSSTELPLELYLKRKYKGKVSPNEIVEYSGRLLKLVFLLSEIDSKDPDGKMSNPQND